MRWVHRALFVTAAMETEYQSRIVPVDEHRAYAYVLTTSVREMANYGRPDARLLEPDQGTGLIWRLFSVFRYEERDGGVYVEAEAIGLSRDIPSSIRPIVQKLVTKVSRNALTVSLTQTRDAMLSRGTHPDTRLEVTQKRSPRPSRSLSFVP